jgi:hypothetical protein
VVSKKEARQLAKRHYELELFAAFIGVSGIAAQIYLWAMVAEWPERALTPLPVQPSVRPWLLEWMTCWTTNFIDTPIYLLNLLRENNRLPDAVQGSEQSRTMSLHSSIGLCNFRPDGGIAGTWLA